MPETIIDLQQVRETFDDFCATYRDDRAWANVAGLFGTASPLGPVTACRELQAMADTAPSEHQGHVYAYAANLISDVCEAIDGQPLR